MGYNCPCVWERRIRKAYIVYPKDVPKDVRMLHVQKWSGFCALVKTVRCLKVKNSVMLTSFTLMAYS